LEEIEAITAIAQSGQDRPVLMLNLNRYKPEAGFPNGSLYLRYVTGLEAFLPAVGGAILWRTPVLGQPVGDQQIDEVLAAWYPSHQAFLDLPNAPGAEQNYGLRGVCVDYAVIHRCPGDRPRLRPHEPVTPC
jgi:hypothetical protein